MPLDTRKKLLKHALTLPPSSARAQCNAMAWYELTDNESIADRMSQNHNCVDGAKRNSLLFVAAGAAKHIKTEEQERKNFYGTFIFEDGSKI